MKLSYLLLGLVLGVSSIQAENVVCSGRSENPFEKSSYHVRVKNGMIEVKQFENERFVFGYTERVVWSSAPGHVYFLGAPSLVLNFDFKNGRPMLEQGALLGVAGPDSSAPTKPGEVKYVDGAVLAEGKRFITRGVDCRIE